MAYDYGSGSKKLEMPNPYRVQNQLLGACAALLCLGGLWALWHSRETLALVSIVVGLGLLSAGVLAAATVARRLRFFFGRGRPASLAPDLAPTVSGSSPAADQVKFLLREGALVYPEPSGAVEGLLYHLAPRLITAPVAIQEQARTAFFNLAALVATALSFVVAWGVFGNEATRPWLGLGYFVFGVVFLLRPVISSSTARLSSASLVALVAAAILAPALVGLAARHLSTVPAWSVAPQATILLVSALVAVGGTLLAALGQVQPPPQTQASSVLERVSLNVPPSLLVDELERHLQEQWVERIPNRRYARAVPVVDAQASSGPIAGELFEETQPLPLAGSAPPGLGEALRSPKHRWLAALDVYATVLMAVALGCALVFASGVDAGEGARERSLHLLGTSTILLVVAAFCFRSSSLLWGRFDFESTLVWVEMAGTWQAAQMGTGNAFNSRMHTENRIVRTEAMTLRVWRARIESVVFGKDGPRQVTAMFSTDPEARELARHLVAFGQSRSSMVAPESAADLARMRSLGVADQALGGASSPASAALSHDDLARLAGQGGQAPEAPAGVRYCPACGHAVAPGARFCGDCGARL